MSVEIRVPSVGESITEVQISAWLKAPGDYVQVDEPVVEIDSDKATLEIPAPASGIISSVLKDVGQNANVGEVIGTIREEQDIGDKTLVTPPKKEPEYKSLESPEGSKNENRSKTESDLSGITIMPAARRMMAEYGIEPGDILPSGIGRITKEDVMAHISKGNTTAAHQVADKKQAQIPSSANQPLSDSITSEPAITFAAGTRQEDVTPMSPMRRSIAERLVEAQKEAALLTTFNEVNLQPVLDLRKRFQDKFQEKYGVKLGIMSFFVKASIDALKAYPKVNAQIRGTDIVYHNYYDIGIAVASGKGLVVPVLRNAELMSFAQIEKAIADLGARAKENKVGLEELKGGTFSITNGGVFGSMLSTPIVNPPQSAILGMHAITERPVAEEGQVVIRPMMYVALTYDHRIIDGREAVSFLKRIKECVEDPSRMLIEV